MQSAMAEETKKRPVTEEDVFLVLQRYSATAILTLLQEVSQFDGDIMDWESLVKKTSTGISSAREYQMLWRHLAYHDPLLERLEDGSEPLDDDSDLEFELETVPATGSEAASEAAACVKVLMSSGTNNDHGQSNRTTLEAPLTINIPNGQTTSAPSDEQQQTRVNRGMNITVPVSIQKQPQQPGSSMEVLDGNGLAGGGIPAKKKRKVWSKEEDMELIAAVQKYGEGNWANILKGDFKHDRTASQLSQRWSILRKRHTNLTTSNGNNMNGGSQSEAVLAARNAFCKALNMPKFGSLSAICSGSGAAQSSTPSAPSAALSALPETAPISAPSPVNQPQSASTPAAAQKVSSAASTKSRIQKKPSEQPAVGPNPLIKAAVYSAGGRIATPSAAVSFIRATMSRSVVHISTKGTQPLPKASVRSAKPSTSNSGTQPSGLQNIVPASMPPPLDGSRLGSQRVQETSGKLATKLPPTSYAGTADPSAQPTQEPKSGSLNSTLLHEKTKENSGTIVPASNATELDNLVSPDQANLVAGEIDKRAHSNSGNSVPASGLQADLLNSQASESQSDGSKADQDMEVEMTENQPTVTESDGANLDPDVDIDQGTGHTICENRDVAEEQLDYIMVTKSKDNRANDVANQ